MLSQLLLTPGSCFSRDEFLWLKVEVLCGLSGPSAFTDKGLIRYMGFRVEWRQNLLEQEDTGAGIPLASKNDLSSLSLVKKVDLLTSYVSLIHFRGG